MPYYLLNLPPELHDNIIDKFAEDYRPSWSALARASSGWRHRVNTHRFHTIRLIKGEASKIQKLAKLVSTGVWREQDSVAHYFSSVKVALGRRRWTDVSSKYMRNLFFDDGSIATILREFSRANQHMPSGKRLYLYPLTTATGGSLTDFSKLANVAPDLFAALLTLCCGQSPLLELELSNISYVPLGFLRDITVSKLTLKYVSIREETGPLAVPFAPLSRIRVLSMFMTPTFLPLVAQKMLPNINEIDINISDVKLMLQVYRDGLSKVTLRTNELWSLYNDKENIPVWPVHMNVLERLGISYMLPFASAFDDRPTRTVFDTLFAQLPPTIPDSLHIEICTDPIPYFPRKVRRQCLRRYRLHIYTRSPFYQLQSLCAARRTRVQIVLLFRFRPVMCERPPLQRLQKACEGQMRNVFSGLEVIPDAVWEVKVEDG